MQYPNILSSSRTSSLISYTVHPRPALVINSKQDSRLSIVSQQMHS